MAHFARLDSESIVIQVDSIHNNEAPDEAAGAAFCRSLYGADTVWKQTSYSDSFRTRFAGIGYRYDADLDAFIDPQPYPSWSLSGANWTPPTPMPLDGKPYRWDEPTLAWLESVEP